MTRKLLDFQASISDVKQVNPLFSTAKARILYTGRNRNMSIITRDSVEKALPTLKNIPIVGEYSVENEDYKGHGGAIDMDSYKYIHTTKPYGVVPESATYEWEEVRGSDGSTREYLVINGVYLWTGRYEEANDVVKNGKGQSMEIEVTDGEWVEDEEAYRIDNFIFSALCILGDEVEPAFEDANITAYSLDKESFKQEFSTMLSELKESLSYEKEENLMLKKLLEKYSLTVEDLTAKGIDFNEITEDDLEAKIIEVFEIENNEQTCEKCNGECNNECEKDADIETKGDVEPQGSDSESNNVEVDAEVKTVVDAVAEPEVDFEAKVKELEAKLETAKDEISTLTTEVEGLRDFKLNVEKKYHEDKAQEMFTNFQLNEVDVEEIDVHAFSLEELEEKCYAILGRKLASKKSFSKEEDSIRINIQSDKVEKDETPYGGLIEKYKNK